MKEEIPGVENFALLETEGRNPRTLALDTLVLEVSSSAIRRELVEGASPVELPENVFAYIRSKGLYI